MTSTNLRMRTKIGVQEDEIRLQRVKIADLESECKCGDELIDAANTALNEKDKRIADLERQLAFQVKATQQEHDCAANQSIRANDLEKQLKASYNSQRMERLKEALLENQASLKRISELERQLAEANGINQKQGVGGVAHSDTPRDAPVVPANSVEDDWEANHCHECLHVHKEKRYCGVEMPSGNILSKTNTCNCRHEKAAEKQQPCNPQGGAPPLAVATPHPPHDCKTCHGSGWIEPEGHEGISRECPKCKPKKTYDGQAFIKELDWMGFCNDWKEHNDVAPTGFDIACHFYEKGKNAIKQPSGGVAPASGEHPQPSVGGWTEELDKQIAGMLYELECRRFEEEHIFPPCSSERYWEIEQKEKDKWMTKAKWISNAIKQNVPPPAQGQPCQSENYSRILKLIIANLTHLYKENHQKPRQDGKKEE